MQRIPRVDKDSAPAGGKPILEKVEKNFGRVPNIFAIVALNTFTNCVNALVRTEVDFPAAPEIN